MQNNLMIDWMIVQEQRQDQLRSVARERLIRHARAARGPSVKRGRKAPGEFRLLMRWRKAAT